MNIKAQSGLVSFFIMAMIAVIIALQVTWPVIDSVLNDETDITVSGESFNISGHADTYMSLANSDITTNGESVYNASYNAIRNTDYTMNYTDGTIQPLSTGGLLFSGTAVYNINYGHSGVTPLANMSTSTTTLVDLIPLFLVLVLLMVFVRPLM